VTIGFFAQMPPARTGVAFYAATLACALSLLTELRVNAAGDVNLYHLGNNHLHREIYSRALAHPGVVVMHDAVLHHFFLGAFSRDQYLDEFVYNYGHWSRTLAETLWAQRGRSAADLRYFEHAMVRRVVEASRAVVVHNRGAARIVRSHAPSAQISVIPHLLSPRSVPVWAVERLRAEWGVSGRTFVFGIFGHLRESKRLKSCFDALERVRANCALMVGGDFASSDLEREMAPRLRAPGVIRAGYSPEDRFWQMAHAVDACLNLRYPAAGETSGISMRLMGAGKPVILTDSEESSDLPETTCLRVDSGLAETEMLAEYMRWLAADREAAREIGRRAEAHVTIQHAPERAARLYLDVLNRVRG
jgi:glycosyltransferase involved in cell wall biosynthesis